MIAILDAHTDEAAAFIEKLNLRGGLEDPNILRTVRKTLRDVQRDGDRAVIKYTRKLDAPRITIDEMRVTDAEIDGASAQVDSEFHDAIGLARTNIERFHQKQLRNSWLSTEADGVVLGHLIRPLRRVGVCVPSVSQLLVSSLLMNLVPALRIAPTHSIGFSISNSTCSGAISLAISTASAKSGTMNATP